ncbi:diacylglycerol kinase [Endozoicomonas montiporae]|uniref:Diacylglycerol kinase n=2 Tax=Endozoicomonas montiporae TaxID=1027273 RepID=A0A081N2N7_9GAMM|nr:dihydrofolate reductase family protein [Endozoicomonas montiporae]AMO57968.1 riboflavin biosynthesis protein RibD C- domain-containing protein [Endozoicomonas montiporae CL-33]KEQ12710.1 diacylglycerol kinase [Endozoicomonas montiporae]
MSNIVYIATSLDGYIADKNHGLDWLHSTPNPDNDDMGFMDFISRVDALVMGRKTFEIVAGFDGEWPYPKPVFVLSRTLNSIPEHLQDKVFLINGDTEAVTSDLHQRGYKNLYIDGGTTIQQFLQQDMIDELIIARIPVVLGGGIPLFGNLEQPLSFKHTETKVHLNAIAQSFYVRNRAH